jgi:hypothetical protein
VKHVILSLKSTGLLQRKLIARSFNDAQNPIGPGFIRTYGARVFVGEIEANRTEPDPLFHVEKAFCQVLGKVSGTPQDVEGHPGCGFLADSRQPGQVLNEMF